MQTWFKEFLQLFGSTEGVLGDPSRQGVGVFWSAIFGLSGFALCGEGVLIHMAIDFNKGDEMNEDAWSIVFTIIGSLLLLLAFFLAMRAKCGELWLSSSPIRIRIGFLTAFGSVVATGTSSLWFFSFVFLCLSIYSVFSKLYFYSR